MIQGRFVDHGNAKNFRDYGFSNNPGYTYCEGRLPLGYARYEGAKRLYGEITDEITERLDRELEVIESKGFASYFLIVWDFCKYARDNDIP